MTDPTRPTHSQSEPQQAEQPAPPIDMQRLTEKVYRLLLEDLRLERARAGSPPAQAGGKR
jgi:hypothetical protein